MSSATGMPEQDPAQQGRGEDEPLLGRAGDASQQDEKGLQFNFVLGTGIIAQVGIWLLTVTIWASVFAHDISLFSAHPLLNSAGILLTTQAILVLQPTHTPIQKRQGTNVHAVLNGTSVLALLAGLIVIEYNKIKTHHTHFESPHAILGLTTYIVFAIQATVGITQYYFPAVYGGIDNAKAIWKYHRVSGYVLLVLSFATIAAATQTPANTGLLHIKLWAIIVLAVIVLIGVFPRIKKQKLGL